jgi:fatty acid-binding protein DegV
MFVNNGTIPVDSEYNNNWKFWCQSLAKVLLIGIEDGVIVPLGRARSRGHAYQQMADMIAEAIGHNHAKIAYVHVGAQHEVERLKELVESKVNVVESLIGELSPALAVHSGPGTTGLCYYPVEP